MNFGTGSSFSVYVVCSEFSRLEAGLLIFFEKFNRRSGGIFSFRLPVFSMCNTCVEFRLDSKSLSARGLLGNS